VATPCPVERIVGSKRRLETNNPPRPYSRHHHYRRPHERDAEREDRASKFFGEGGGATTKLFHRTSSPANHRFGASITGGIGLAQTAHAQGGHRLILPGSSPVTLLGFGPTVSDSSKILTPWRPPLDRKDAFASSQTRQQSGSGIAAVVAGYVPPSIARSIS
jgi:hypothetical protein